MSSLTGRFGAELVGHIIRRFQCERHRGGPVTFQLQDKSGGAGGPRRALVLVSVR